MKRSFKSKIISAALALLLGFGGLFTGNSHVNAAEDDIYKLMMLRSRIFMDILLLNITGRWSTGLHVYRTG